MSSKERWKILREDKFILAVYKPPSLVVQGSRRMEESLFLQLKEYLKVRDKRPGNVYLAVVHRLDKPVSGAVLFAKRSKWAGKLFQIIQRGDLAKVYLAVVEGEFLGNGFLTDYLRYDERSRKVIPLEEEDLTAKRAITYFECLYSKGGYSVVLLSPLTGRKHQLRVATSCRGAPIVGDKLYGSKKNLGNRILLHSLFLGFPHPSTGKTEEIFCPPSPSFVETALSGMKDPWVKEVFNLLDKPFISEFAKKVRPVWEKEFSYVSGKDLVKM